MPRRPGRRQCPRSYRPHGLLLPVRLSVFSAGGAPGPSASPAVPSRPGLFYIGAAGRRRGGARDRFCRAPRLGAAPRRQIGVRDDGGASDVLALQSRRHLRPARGSAESSRQKVTTATVSTSSPVDAGQDLDPRAPRGSRSRPWSAAISAVHPQNPDIATCGGLGNIPSRAQPGARRSLRIRKDRRPDLGKACPFKVKRIRQHRPASALTLEPEKGTEHAFFARGCGRTQRAKPWTIDFPGHGWGPVSPVRPTRRHDRGRSLSRAAAEKLMFRQGPAVLRISQARPQARLTRLIEAGGGPGGVYRSDRNGGTPPHPLPWAGWNTSQHPSLQSAPFYLRAQSTTPIRSSRINRLSLRVNTAALEGPTERRPKTWTGPGPRPHGEQPRQTSGFNPTNNRK